MKANRCLKRVALFLFPAFLISGILITEKPRPPESFTNIITTATLHDTLPHEMCEALNAREINGVRVHRNTGLDTFYFEYEADHETLIKVISQSSFLLHSKRSDSGCREITYAEVYPDKHRLSSEALNSISFFMNIDPGKFQYYECVKTPLKHTLILNKASDQVLHKVELI